MPWRRYYDWATAEVRSGWTRWLLALPLLAVVPLMLVAGLIGHALNDTAERGLIFAALLPIPLWGGYCWWRILRELAPYGRIAGASWRDGWRAAWAILRRGGKAR